MNLNQTKTILANRYPQLIRPFGHSKRMNCHYMVIGMVLFLTGILQQANAQLDNRTFYAKDTLIGEKNHLFLKFKSIAFNRNDEYYTDFASGQTFFGYQVNPELEYYFSDDIALSIGVFATQDFGNNRFTQVQPTYQLKINRNNDQFLFGNINGNLNHQYIEPLYDFNSLFLRPRETGVQYLAKHTKWKGDFWLDWQRNIYPGSDYLEQIYGGFNVEWSPIKNETFQFAIPVQYIVHHEGGQIDVSPDKLQLKSNGAFGIKGSIFAKSFFEELKMEHHWAWHLSHLTDTSQFYQKGSGWYLNLSARHKNHWIMLSYWQGNGFKALRGAPIYYSESVSFKHSGSLQKSRKLLFLRFISNFDLTEDVRLSLRLEPNYDFSRSWKYTFSQRLPDFSHGLYINIEKRFFVKNLKRGETN